MSSPWIDNYKYDQNGVFQQIQKEEFVYDESYVELYDSPEYKMNATSLSKTRLHFLMFCMDKYDSDHNKYLNMRLLDFGCGNGNFLISNELHRKIHSMEFFGYDLYEKHHDQKNYKFIDSPFDKRWDIVCFWDSLEHLKDPYDTVKKLDSKYVAVSLPWLPINLNKFDEWKHKKPDEHLHHFNQESLIKFFDSLGYDCICVSNIEDTIRKSDINKPNILTGVFVKREVK